MITMSSAQAYRGRFAPTPSGPLHLGSLTTALASFLQARSAGGVWLLRIDDLDRARCPPGMDDTILRQLEAHGLLWDEEPRRQSCCRDEYAAALDVLEHRGLLYPCACSRAALRRSARPGPDDPIYPGTCRERVLQAPGGGPSHALRVRVNATTLCFDDRCQGRVCRDLVNEVGDFVVRRADGAPAYQLACAVDEHAQKITEVVRGVDLLGSTFRQRWLQQELALAPPRYCHVPIVVDARGRKLSKQNYALGLDTASASANLARGLSMLGFHIPAALHNAPPGEILHWATDRWDAASIPRAAQIHPL